MMYWITIGDYFVNKQTVDDNNRDGPTMRTYEAGAIGVEFGDERKAELGEHGVEQHLDLQRVLFADVHMNLRARRRR